MINLYSKKYSLSDCVEYIIKENHPLYQRITRKQLHELTKIDPEFNEPTHIAIQVHIRHKDKQNNDEWYMIFSNLGQVLVTTGDVLEEYRLDKPDFFFNFHVRKNNQWKQVNKQDCQLSLSGTKDWKATCDFEVIFNHFGLDGTDEYAPFKGWFKVQT